MRAGRRVDDRLVAPCCSSAGSKFAMLFVCEYHGGQSTQRTPPSIVRLLRRLPRVLHEDVGRERAPLGQRALADLGVVREQAQRRVGDAERRCAPAPLLRNSKRPFWLLVLPGIGWTLIWSKSSSPEYSNDDAALERVAALAPSVVAFVNVWIGPCDEDGYGPPSISVKLAMVIVGILSGISLFSGKMYG